MSSLTLSEARDGLFERFNADWTAFASAVNGGLVPHVDWQGDDDGAKRDTSKPWARMSIFHGLSFQQTAGPVGGRIFQRNGNVLINIFAPLSNGQGLTQAEALATIAGNAFEGKTAGPGGCIWFRNVSIQEIGPDGAWFQFNINADFLYDELK